MENKNFLWNLINKYDQIVICVQRNNDLDTCSCALALAELITETFGKSKKVFILGWSGKSRFLPEIEKYAKKKPDWEKDTLLVLSEISDKKELNEWQSKQIKQAKEVMSINHHPVTEEEKAELKKCIGEDKTYHTANIPSLSSACEVLWKLVQTDWVITKRICEIIFLGLYGDSKGFTSTTVSSLTFRHVAELMERGNMNAGSIILGMKQRPPSHLMLFADTLTESVHEGNLLFMALKPKNVQRRIPQIMIKKKDGQIRQRSLITYIPRWVGEYTTFNTIIFCHYSLYDPYNSTKRFIYIILVEENPALARILKEHGFKQNRNRWSREMTFSNLTKMVEKYKDIFIS